MRQADVAAACGRDRSVISRWEAGEIEPDAVDLARLAALFSVPVAGLLLLASGAGRSRARRGGPVPGPAVGRRLLAARLTAEIGVVDLSRRAHVSPRRLARIEGGACPSLAELGRLLDGLRIEPGEFVAEGAES